MSTVWFKPTNTIKTEGDVAYSYLISYLILSVTEELAFKKKKECDSQMKIVILFGLVALVP